jgi:hypothetical protein
LLANDAFRRQLSAQGNPDTIRRIDFRGELSRRSHNGGEIGEKVLAIRAVRKMLAGFQG